MKNLLDLELNNMEELFADMNEPKFRAKQVFGWMYKGVDSFAQMSNLPARLRNKLEESFTIDVPKIIKVQQSKLDGTRKYLFEMSDGNAIESVFMKYKFGNSICVSSQVGCRMGCRFCASTLGGLLRNLTPGEITGQILAAEKNTGERINHVVVMGTGEPFDNYENVAAFIRIINDKAGLNIGMRNITVSTCGLVPAIHRFGTDFPQVNLAISLHGTDDDTRDAMMPINKSYPIESLLKACRRYTENTSRRVTFEYTLVKGVNDGKKDAESLVKLLKGMLCHVNLIPLNKVEETGLETSSRTSALEFQKILESSGIPATIRRELGDDIDAACGQLRLNARHNETDSKK